MDGNGNHELAALVARLDRRIVELEATVARLTVDHAASPTEPAMEEPDGGLSRRRLMRMVGTGAAVGVAAIGATVAGVTPAAADPNNPMVIGADNTGAASITSLTSSPTPNSSTFAAINNAADRPIGVYGIAGPTSGGPVSGGGVVGNSRDQSGVAGFSSTNTGVYGSSSSSVGVYGISSSNVAVYAEGGSGASAVYAVSFAPSNSEVVGVFGYAKNNPGVLGESDTTHGVIGLTQGTKRGNYTPSGLLGQASTGVGVQGISMSAGVAGQFSGGRAQLYLVPAAITGAPTTGTHKIGELFLDKTGALYVCKTAGSPGKWKLLG